MGQFQIEGVTVLAQKKPFRNRIKNTRNRRQNILTKPPQIIIPKKTRLQHKRERYTWWGITIGKRVFGNTCNKRASETPIDKRVFGNYER